MVVPLDVAITVLVIACMSMALQLVILTVEISRVRRDLRLTLKTCVELNHCVNPWAGETMTTEPNLPPKIARNLTRRSWWFPPLPKRKRRPPTDSTP